MLIKTHLAGILFCLCWQFSAIADDGLFAGTREQAPVLEFAEADIFVEQNFTDGDTEVVMSAKGGDSGLKSFRLVAPDGAVVYAFKSPLAEEHQASRNLGAREIVIESPEPADINAVLNAYPEGDYTFIGKTFNGEYLRSQRRLSHRIPAAANIQYPVNGDLVSRFGLLLRWQGGNEVLSYLLEVKNETTEQSVEVELPAGSSEFSLPADWLQGDTEYQVSIFVINQEGNKTASEISFFTLAE